jgi:hypothetical protein
MRIFLILPVFIVLLQGCTSPFAKYYEKLPKPHALAVQEWLEDKIYYRDTK